MATERKHLIPYKVLRQFKSLQEVSNNIINNIHNS